MLHLVPDAANDLRALDSRATFTTLYESLYETPPAYVAQLMALTPYAADDPRSLALRPLPVYRAPHTHPLNDMEQSQALLLDHERYEDSVTATIRATSAQAAPTPIYTRWWREHILLQAASGDDLFSING